MRLKQLLMCSQAKESRFGSLVTVGERFGDDFVAARNVGKLSTTTAQTIGSAIL
jgi:hypothetical protein